MSSSGHIKARDQLRVGVFGLKVRLGASLGKRHFFD